MFLPLCVAFFIVQFIFATLFIKAGWPESTKKGFYFKMVSATVFVAFGFYCAYTAGFETAYSRLIPLGLILGWVGDFCLTFDPFLKGKPKSVTAAVYIFGRVAFLAGHVIYIIAFFKLMKEAGKSVNFLFFAVAAALMCLAVLLKFLLKVKLGKIGAGVAVYAAMILTMLTAACFAAFGYGDSMILRVALPLGAFLFVCSDFSLALKMFSAERFDTLEIRTIYIYTYFFAQMLIAGSIAPV